MFRHLARDRIELEDTRPRLGIGAVIVELTMMAGAPLFRSVAAGQNNFEILVYGSEMVPPGNTMVELHSNVAAQGTTQTEAGVVGPQCGRKISPCPAWKARCSI